MDVHDAIAELTGRRRADAALALCELAGLEHTATSSRLAQQILEVAAAVLTDETTARALRRDGGWAGALRMLEESWFGPLPDDPPGTTAVLALLADMPTQEITALGRRVRRGELVELAVQADGGQDAEARGEGLVVELLHWALAVATRPEETRLDWKQTGPQRRDAVIELPDAATDLWVRAEVDARSGRYQVGPGPREVPGYVHAHPLRFGRTATLGGAVLLAEHAAAECVAALSTLRTWEFRLLLPRPVAADACPSLREVLTAVRDDGDGRVVDLLDLAATVRDLGDAIAEPLGGPAGGHYLVGSLDPSGTGPSLGTLTGLVVDNLNLPATRPGEEANTAPVDSPRYRRHLLRQRAGFDPLVERFLVAADAVATGPAPAAVRYAAGRQALQAGDLQALLGVDAIERYHGEDVARWVHALPRDPSQLGAYVNDWWYSRHPEYRPDGGHTNG